MSSKQSPGFDFSSAMLRLCIDMCNRVPELSHIDMSRVMVGFRQTRKAVPHGYQASVTPMRFEAGSLETKRRGRKYTVEQQFNDQGEEYLYLLSFYLPRYLNHSLEEKLMTVIHELWHISPDFDGDIRRHSGRCYVHGPSGDAYDELATKLSQAWLALDPPVDCYEFLQLSFEELASEFGGVFGKKTPTPKLILA